MDTLEEAYEKIANNQQDQIRLYESDVYYAKIAIKYNLGIDIPIDEVYNLLYSEGLLPWRYYLDSPQRVKRMKGIFDDRP